MKIATLATCYNRKSETLSALKSLHAQTLPSHVNVQHVIVDDASCDQTAESVKEIFPDVTIINGTGELYWAGGMRYGWSEYAKNIDFDYIFLYNDDVYLESDALSRLIETSSEVQHEWQSKDHVIIGSFHNGGSPPVTTYGGLVRSNWWHPLRFKIIDPPEDKYIFVQTLNMNACLISRDLIEKTGFLSEYFIHSGADFEFGLKALRLGGRVVLAKGYFGECKRNLHHDNFIENAKNIIDCFNKFLGPKQQPLKQRLKYFRIYGGGLWFIFFLIPYLILPFKYIWMKYLHRMFR